MRCLLREEVVCKRLVVESSGDDFPSSPVNRAPYGSLREHEFAVRVVKCIEHSSTRLIRLCKQNTSERNMCYGQSQLGIRESAKPAGLCRGARDGERGLPDDAQGLLRVRGRARARHCDPEEAGVRSHAAPAGEPAQLDPGAREEGPATSRCEEL